MDDADKRLLCNYFELLDAERAHAARCPFPRAAELQEAERLAREAAGAPPSQGRCCIVWCAGRSFVPPGEPAIPDRARCVLPPHGDDVDHLVVVDGRRVAMPRRALPEDRQGGAAGARGAARRLGETEGRGVMAKWFDSVLHETRGTRGTSWPAAASAGTPRRGTSRRRTGRSAR